MQAPFPFVIGDRESTANEDAVRLDSFCHGNGGTVSKEGAVSSV